MSFDDIMLGIRRLRTSVRTSTGRPEAMPRDKIRLLGQNLAAKLQSSNQAQNQHQRASNMGTLQPQSTHTPRTRLLNLGLGILQRPPPSQQPPPTEEQKRQMVEQQKLKVLENKQLAVKAKKKRLDRLQGLSVDRT